MIAAYETNTPLAALTIEHPKPAPRTAPVPKPRHLPPTRSPVNIQLNKKRENLPEIVGVVLKNQNNPQDNIDRDLQIWSSIVPTNEDEVLSLLSTDSEPSYRKFHLEDKASINSSVISQESTQDCNASGGVKENRSVTSLKSVDSIPAFLGNGNMKKWSNFEDLDELSDDRTTESKWEVGDTTDTGTFQFLLTTKNCPLCCLCFAYMYIVMF